MKKLYFCTGTNACGKSSLAKYLIGQSEERILFPEYKSMVCVSRTNNMLVVGRYSAATTSGGCDTIRKKEYTQNILKNIWSLPEDIFMEGYLIGTKIWIDELLAINAAGERQIYFVHQNTTLQTCFNRILGRSGKTQEQLSGNGANVISKYNSILKFKDWLKKERPQIKILDIDTENLTTSEACAQLLNLTKDGN